MDMEKEQLTLEMVRNLINQKNVSKLRELFEEYEEIDIAEICNQLEDVADLLFIFKTVKSDYTAELFSYLDSEQQEKLINVFNDKQLTDLLANSYTDDIVDFIEDMPANLVTRVLRVSDRETRADINRLLNYKEGTAGSIMTTEYIELRNTLTAQEALDAIRKRGHQAETVLTTFIIDNKRNLVGVLYLDELVFAQPETSISEIMNEEFKTCRVNDDQEEVADKFKRYDLTAIPVLNEDNRLIGVITIDDIVDVIEKEATEDFVKMSGAQPLENEYLKTSAFTLARKRITWLLILMISATFTSMIISHFENTLQSAAILSAFIPMFMDTGGNAGGQTTSIVTRGLAVKEFSTKDYFKVLWKEFRVALMTGLVIALVNFGWIMLELSTGIIKSTSSIPNIEIAGLVSLTLFFVIILAKSLGASLPMLAKAIHLDPALMSGPLVTTFVDTFSLIVYFFLITQVFHII